MNNEQVVGTQNQLQLKGIKITLVFFAPELGSLKIKFKKIRIYSL